MSEFQPLNDELHQFEQNLKSLVPTAPVLNEAEIMYRLGRESALSESRLTLRHWQLSTLATSLCALLSSSLFWFVGDETSHSPGTPVAEQTIPIETDPVPEPSPVLLPEKTELVEVEQPPSPAVPVVADTKPFIQQNNRWWASFLNVSAPAPDSYLGLRNLVLEQGVDALPETSGSGGNRSDREPLNSSPRRVRQWLEESDLT